MTTTKGVLMCVAVAVAAGGAGLLAGLLIAPASGWETRRRWIRRAEDEKDALERMGRRATQDAARHAKDFLGDTLERGKEAVSGLVGS